MFISQYLCSFRQKENINSLKAILKREDESIRDFTCRFGQVVQQIDIYSMDAVLQNFRRSFGPTTLFFQSLSLDPPAIMEELYRRANKNSTLEDNIRAASQTVMITAQNSKPQRANPNRKEARTRIRSAPKKIRKKKKKKKKKKKEPPQFTPLNISYDRLLPLIQDHLDFKWPLPMRANPDQHNRSLRCDYHRDHDHETNCCQSLKFLVEKLIRAGHLRRYIWEPTHGTETAPAADRAITGVEHPSKPQPTSTSYWEARPMTNTSPNDREEKCSVQSQSEPG